MSCEVTVNDIHNKVSKDITMNFPQAQEKGIGNLFIEETSGNKNFLGSQLKKLVQEINSEYLSFKHGNVVNAYKEAHGYLVEISPKQELADAMTEQNIRDEVGNDFYMGDDALREQEEFNSPHTRSNYSLKSVNILSSDKAKQVFEKGQKNNWDLNKILTELQIPKEQKQLILNLGITDREQIALELTSNYSYTVEINTAKSGKKIAPGNSNEFMLNGIHYYTNGDIYEINGNIVSKEIFNNSVSENTIDENSSYYSNLTVSGGTNYTENEIATPAITPSIKGHAQFSTDNGIGWFRSDDKLNTDGNIYVTEDEENLSYQELENGKIEVFKEGFGVNFGKSESLGIYNSWEDFQNTQTNKVQSFTNTKTRRILEVQSDLFQKGRDRENLSSFEENPYEYGGLVENNHVVYSDYKIIAKFNTKEEAEKFIQKNVKGDTNENQFLQLLNKNNNWVTFFVKSIIQDSAKKGYEKVLFPKGDTAAKIEGHQTLEEFKKQKEDRINAISNIEVVENEEYKKIGEEAYSLKLNNGKLEGVFNTKEDANKHIEEYSSEINQLKQELERVEREGFAALKPIYNFYENTVANILKKQRYNPQVITDEYGNTWNEIIITPETEEEIYLSPHTRSNAAQVNSKEPITDNFVEFVQHKAQELQNTKRDINTVKQQLKFKDITENRAKLKQLEEKQRIIENQLEQLGKNESEYMFFAIEEDLDALTEVLENSDDIHNVDEVRKKIEFYETLFENIALNKEQDAHFGELTSKLTSLRANYNKSLKEKVKTGLDNSGLVKRATKRLSEELGEEVTTEDLLVANADISKWTENMLGIISSDTGDTILPQFLFAEFNKEVRRETEGIQLLIDKLNGFLRSSGMTDFDWVLSKDSDGKKDGYLIDVYDNAWFKAWNKRNKALKNFYSKLYGKSSNRELNAAYKKLMNWYTANTHFIDFTRLRVVKDIYGIPGSEYENYFTYTESEMEAYEQNLKMQLGPRYEDTLELILNKLKKFEELKFDTPDSTYKNRNIASSNIWELLAQSKKHEQLNKEYRDLGLKLTTARKGGKEYKDILARQSEILRLLARPLGTIDYEYTNDKGEVKRSNVLFNKFDDLSVLPKSTLNVGGMTIDSNFYSKEYQEMLEDPAKVEYWNILKEMSDYINSTYETDPFHRLSYPKVEQQYAERLLKDIKFIRENPTSMKGLGQLFHGLGHEYKSWFFEKGSRQEDSEIGIRSNHSDKSKNEIRQKALIYQIKGMSKKDAYQKARGEIVESYSTDINTAMKAVLIEAALHNARLKTEPLAKSIQKVFYDIKDKNNMTRERANRRLAFWVDKIIMNKSFAYRGSTNIEGQTIGLDITAKDLDKKRNFFSRFLNKLGDTKFVKEIGDRKILKLLSENDKKIVKDLKDLRKTGGAAEFTIDNLGFKLQKTINPETKETVYVVNGNPEATKEEFDKAFQDYITAHVNSLGLDLNLAGLIDGTMKTIIFKGLGLNPLSGIFNRIEGKNTGMIMDLTGEYWTTGNIDVANMFLFGANINKMSPDQLPVSIRGRREQIKLFQEVIGRLKVLQDRKNELQRNVEDSKFNTDKLNIFQFAVEHPEFKNQGAIILSVMMDMKVTDNNGNEHPLFDKDKMTFTPFQLDANGVIQIKPEFSNSFDFASEEVSDMVLQIEAAVSHSQGNYNQFDIMKIKESIWGRAATVFMTWFPEHLDQRWGVRDANKDFNINLFSGKKRQDGRFVSGYKASKPIFGIYMLTALGISYGSLGVLGLAGVGAIGAFVFNRYLKNIKNTTPRDAEHIKESANFLKAVIVETMNYPMRLASTSYRPGKIVEKLTGGEAFAKANLTEEQIGSISAMARELGIMLSFLMAKLAMGMLMYDDDDDKDSPARMRYNFIQNQLSRYITTLNTWSNPFHLVEENGRIATWSQLESINKLMDVIIFDTDMDKIPKAMIDASPLPRFVSKPFTGLAHWEDKANYDNDPKVQFKGITPSLKWTEELYKDIATDGEKPAEKEYDEIRRERRKEIKDNLMSKYGSNKHKIGAITDVLMEMEFGKKPDGMSYKEALEILDAGQKLSEPSAKAVDRLVSKLEDLGVEPEEINEIINSEFGN